MDWRRDVDRLNSRVFVGPVLCARCLLIVFGDVALDVARLDCADRIGVTWRLRPAERDGVTVAEAEADLESERIRAEEENEKE